MEHPVSLIKTYPSDKQPPMQKLGLIYQAEHISNNMLTGAFT